VKHVEVVLMNFILNIH